MESGPEHFVDIDRIFSSAFCNSKIWIEILIAFGVFEIEFPGLFSNSQFPYAPNSACSVAESVGYNMPEVVLAMSNLHCCYPSTLTSRILPFGHGRRTVFGSVFLTKNNSTFEFTEFEFSEFLVTAPDVQSRIDYGAMPMK